MNYTRKVLLTLGMVTFINCNNQHANNQEASLNAERAKASDASEVFSPMTFTIGDVISPLPTCAPPLCSETSSTVFLNTVVDCSEKIVGDIQVSHVVTSEDGVPMVHIFAAGLTRSYDVGAGAFKCMGFEQKTIEVTIPNTMGLTKDNIKIMELTPVIDGKAGLPGSDIDPDADKSALLFAGTIEDAQFNPQTQEVELTLSYADVCLEHAFELKYDDHCLESFPAQCSASLLYTKGSSDSCEMPITDHKVSFSVADEIFNLGHHFLFISGENPEKGKSVFIKAP